MSNRTGRIAVNGRLDWIDLFRGLAVVWMIEAHVTNAFLDSSFRAGALFDWLNYFNGLVAPAFLWIAGYLQGLSMRRNLGFVKRSKWMRLAALAACGYALHFPFDSLWAQNWEQALRIGSQVDVLPCLALSLALILAIQRWAGRWADLALGAGILGFVGLALAAQTWHSVPVPLLAWLNGSTGSLFPLFPWTGFVLAGALASGWEKDFRAWGGPLLCIALGFLLPKPIPFSSFSPAFFLERLGWVLLAAFLGSRSFSFPQGLRLIGRESLLIYLLHLILISVLANQIGLGRTLGFWGALGLYAVLLAVCALAAWANQVRKSRAAPSGPI